MTGQPFDTVIVRLGGEIGIKADWTRRLYERRLVTNIRAALKHHAVPYSRLVKRFGRLYVKTTQPRRTAAVLGRIFGVSSASPALETTSNLDDILMVSIRLAKSMFKEEKSFAVSCHRVGEHPYTSHDVCKQIGHGILTSLPELKLHVNLTHPEQELQVEIRENAAYVFTSIVKGPGGLPLGTQPRVICLLKGDMQSAAACWMTMKRGCPPILVHIRTRNLARKLDISKIRAAAEKLSQWTVGSPSTLRIIQIPQNSQQIIQRQTPKMANLLLKRLMLRTAQYMAQIENGEGIVTGDSLGERADQTLHYFRMQDEAVMSYPVYRPLLGFDDDGIAETARQIGFSLTSVRDSRDTALGKRAKAIGVNLKEVRRVENKLNMKKVIEDSLKSLKIVQL